MFYCPLHYTRSVKLALQSENSNILNSVLTPLGESFISGCLKKLETMEKELDEQNEEWIEHYHARKLWINTTRDNLKKWFAMAYDTASIKLSILGPNYPKEGKEEMIIQYVTEYCNNQLAISQWDVMTSPSSVKLSISGHGDITLNSLIDGLDNMNLNK